MFMGFGILLNSTERLMVTSNDYDKNVYKMKICVMGICDLFRGTELQAQFPGFKLNGRWATGNRGRSFSTTVNLKALSLLIF